MGPHIRSKPLYALRMTDKEAMFQRWSELFEGLLSDQRTVQESSLAKIPQVNVKLELDGPPIREEIKKATMQLKVGKSPGIDGIPAEVYQHGEKQCSIRSRICSSTVGRKGLPQDLRDAVIISLYKK